jgi:MFS family permease
MEDRPMTGDAPTDLRRHPVFQRLWVSQLASVIGMAVADVSLPILLYQLTGSPLQTSVVVALRVGPYTVFGLLAGAYADRLDRRRVMLVGDTINVALVASVPVAAATGTLSVTHLYIVAAASATAWVWTDAAFFGALPAAVGRSRIVAANSALYSTRMVATTVVPGAAGAVAAGIGAYAFSVTAACYALSAVAILLVIRAGQRLDDRGDDQHRSADRPGLGHDIAEGLRFIWRHRLVRALTLLGVGNSLTGGAFSGLLVVYGVESLGLGDDDPRLGVLYAVGAIGALAGTLALPRLTRRVGIERVTLIGLTAATACALAVVAVPSFAWVAGALAAYEAMYLMVVVNGISLRQRVTPDALASRVNTSARLVATSGGPAGALLAGALAQLWSVRGALAVTVGGVALSTVAAWLSPLRTASTDREDHRLTA